MQDQNRDDARDDAPEQQPPTTVERPGAAMPSDADAEADFEVGLAAFLPEGVVLAGDDATEPDGVEDEGVHEDDAAPAPDGASGYGAAEPEGDPTPDAPAAGFEAPQPEPEPEVDLELLGSLEDDLADVDAALAAIDSGDLGASPLLRRLLDEHAGTPPAT